MTLIKRLAVALFFLAISSPAIAIETPDTTSEETQAFEEMFGKGPQEEDIYRTDRLLLTATGSLKPVYLAPSVASVITKEDIEKMGATTLDEVLQTVPGLHASPSNKNQMNSVFSIRGIQNSLNPHVLIMMNGLPTTYVFTGGRPHGFKLPVSMISRIEVVRGPGSAVFGADAFAGTINIITKDGQEINGTQAGSRYGTFNSSDIWLQNGGQYGGWDVAIGLEWMKSKGDNDRTIDTDLQTNLDAGLGTNASLAPGALNTEYEIFNGNFSLAKDQWTFRLWGWLTNNSAIADGVTQTLAPDSYVNSKQFIADLSYHNDTLLKDTAFDTRLSYRYQKVDSLFQLFPPGTKLPIGADGNIDFYAPAGITAFPDGVIGDPADEDDYYGIEQVIFYEGLKQNKFRLAMGYKYIETSTTESKNFGPGILDGSQAVADGTLINVTGTDFIFMGDKTRNLTFISLQDEFSFARNWELTAGIRYDHYSDFGHTINPRLALVWETRYDLTTKLMYGSAFRPPSFNELYTKNNPSNLGNENLAPETTDTYELAFDYQPTSRLRTILSIFYYEIDDLIDLVNDPGQTTQTAQNAKNQQGYGLELEADWEVLDTLHINANLASQRSKNKETKEIVPDTPALQFYTNIHWQFTPDWSVNSQYFWIGDRHRAADDTREQIKDNDIVNLTLQNKKIFDHWDLKIGIFNLFDENIREPSQATISNDYPMEGRSIFAELRLHY